MENERIIQNIKLIKIMKSCGQTDAEIAKYVGLSVREFLEAIDGDEYLKEIYAQASQKLATDIEREFLNNVMGQLERGENSDAKWLLERTNPKYAKKDQVEVNIRSIDDVIREHGK